MKAYQHIKNFKLTPTPPDNNFIRNAPPGTLFLVSEDGQEWYESQQLFSPDTTKIMYDEGGVIWGGVNKPVPQRGDVYAVSMLWPVDMSVVEMDVDLCPDNCHGDGKWRYIDNCIKEIPVDYISIAESKKSQLLAEAENTIQLLERAVRLDMATDEEYTRLKAWERYSVLVSRVDTTNPEWPDKPE
ncbi:tail fiber assembly protein [Escherichia fergusonii]|uniref:tail fiber assembly protein n=1 Tax=Escherichia fergusonii TaxID=564 RepID=UPI0035BEF8AC